MCDKYYIISLKHTREDEQYLTLWRPDNGGYCYFREYAGVYDGYEKGYHDSDNNIPVLEKVLDEMFVEVEYRGEKVNAVLNTPENRKILGIRKNQLSK